MDFVHPQYVTPMWEDSNHVIRLLLPLSKPEKGTVKKHGHTQAHTHTHPFVLCKLLVLKPPERLEMLINLFVFDEGQHVECSTQRTLKKSRG